MTSAVAYGSQRGVVVAYEDLYHEQLHGLIKALHRDAGRPGIILESATVKGTGGFVADVPLLLRTALKQTRRPPDRLVCLADADRPQNLVTGAPAAPRGDDPEALRRWVLELETAWKNRLVAEGHLAVDTAARLEVVCLRWSKESVLVSCPAALLAYAHAGVDRDRVTAELEACTPNPMALADGDFAVRYRNPSVCMRSIITTMRGRKYKKGLHDEDILRDHIAPDKNRRAEVLKRCPDLGRLLDELK